MNAEAIIIAILGVAGSIAVASLNARANKRKWAAEAKKLAAETEKVAAERVKVDVSALSGIIDVLRDRVIEVEAEQKKTESRYRALERKFEILCDWLRGAGFDPDRIIAEGLQGG